MNVGNIYADIPEFQNPSILTGDVYRPDLLLVIPDKSLYIVELTVGYETNLHKNVERKREKYLVKEQSKQFYSVKFINLSISSLGLFDKEYSNFIDMLNTLGMDRKHQQYYIRKMISIAIRSTYYIFCCRNKDWSKPDLLNALILTLIYFVNIPCMYL